MIRLEELMYALTAVVLRYHDSQNVKVKFCTESSLTAYYSKAIQIINNKESRFEEVLDAAAENCTTKLDYKDRLPLLGFITNQIVYLHALLNRKVSFSNEEIERNKINIARLFRELNILLYIPKGRAIKVTLCNPIANTNSETSLLGLWDNTIKTSWLGSGAPCRSGLMIKETVLDRFNVSKESLDEEIKEIAKQICMEHQQVILVNELLAEIASLRAVNLSQKQSHELVCEQHTKICQGLEQRIVEMQTTLEELTLTKGLSDNSSAMSLPQTKSLANIQCSPFYAHFFGLNKNGAVGVVAAIPEEKTERACCELD